MSNPYEAPQSDFEPLLPDPDLLSEIEVDGKYIIARTGVALPARCIKCNADCGENDKRITKVVYYNPKWIYILILVNLIVLVIVYLITRKPLKITYSICSKHYLNNITESILCALSFVAAIACFIFGISNELPILFLISFVFSIVFIVLLVRTSRLIMASKYRNGDFWIGGACPDFLDSLNT